MNRPVEAIDVYDDVVNRFGDADKDELREQVAKALYYKGITLGEMNRPVEAIDVYDDVVNRFQGTTETGLQDLVTRVLDLKGKLSDRIIQSDS